ATAIVGSIQQRATSPAATLGVRSTWLQEFLAAGHINLISMLIVATCSSRFAAAYGGGRGARCSMLGARYATVVVL
ncbi:MAG: hypothetical protein ACW7DZ_11730, partial [Paraglaciecola chathamensis]